MKTTIYCQFADSSEEAIVSLFGNPQDPDLYPNQGAVLSDDPRYVAYHDAAGPFMQRYMVKPGE